MTARLGALGMISAFAFLPLPAHAGERNVDERSVTISVRIDPLECVTGCGGSPPGGHLPTTGLASIEPLLWIALALLVVGAVFAIRARRARRRRLVSRRGSRTPYAVLSDARAPVAEGFGSFAPSPSRRGAAGRHETERGDGACPK